VLLAGCAFAQGIGPHNAGPRRYSMPVGDGGSSEWEMMITFEGYTRSETLTNFPALVVFTNGMSGGTFQYSQFASTNGYDLRFADSTEATNLNYEIEKWDPTDLATYSPTNLGNCVMWLDASQISGLSDGQQVTNWTDMSGAGNNATHAGGDNLYYRTNVLNGKPVVRFDASGNSALDFTTRLTDIRTVFWVLKETATDNQHFMLGDSTEYHFHRGLSGYLWDGNTHANIKNGTTKLMGDVVGNYGLTTALGTGFRLLSVVTTGDVTASRISKDRGITARSWDGDIAEIIIYDRALTTNEENEVGAYLTSKYALATRYPQMGESCVWVQVPNFTSNCYIRAYWGNPAATNQLPCTTNGATWDSTFAAVWHMQQTNAQDSTSNRMNGTSFNNTLATGQIGYGGSFNGSSAYVDLPDGFANFANGLTVSVWANPTNAASWSRFVDFGNGSANNNILFARNSTSANLTYEVYSGGGSGGQVTATGALVLNTWQYLTAAENSSGAATIYKNGSQATSGSTAVPSNVTRVNNYIGKSNWGDALYGGMMDEVRIESVARSSNWVWACWMNMASNHVFNKYDPPGD
jgi:hypothetical protein